MNRRPAPLTIAGTFLGLALAATIGCNTILGNEEGTPRVTSASTPSDAGTAIQASQGAVCARDAGTKACFGLCVELNDPATGCGGESCVACDPKNTKGTSCRGSDVTFECSYGACQDDFADCDQVKANGCEVSLTSKENCGTCGQTCDGDSVCFKDEDAGTHACLEGCPEGTQECTPGACANTNTSPLHCGACGKACDDTAGGATATCAGGQCSYTCGANQRHCPAKGCVSRLNPNSCGAACVVCPQRPNSIPVCTGDSCGIQCSDGWANNDGDSTNGCETFVPTPVDPGDPCCGGSSGSVPIQNRLPPFECQHKICPY